MPLTRLFSTGVRLLFFKAQHRGDDRTVDLLPVEVPVKEHTRKDGTYVVPHRAIRYKKQPKKPEQAGREQAAVADLFGETKAPASKPSAAPAFTPTHELPDGTKVVAHPDEPNVWVDADGTEYEGDNAYPLEQADSVAAERPVDAAKDEDETAKYALPEGATFRPGKGVIGAGKWMVELADGHSTALFPSKEQAADAARKKGQILTSLCAAPTLRLWPVHSDSNFPALSIT